MRVNWPAILVATVVFFLFGGLWYNVLGPAWRDALGASAPPTSTSAYAYIVAVIMSFFLSYGLARVLSWRGDYSVYRGARIGISLALLIFGTMTWMTYAFELRGATLGWINVGYVAIGMGIQGAILGAWKPKT
ncbi:MAG TPA: DUF1761 domain-containing protein [Candidatus Dormibacteraeota bacterium]|nr:DUF1761 domain-containing protein [Candidatus Dormibacteraeota bacterium]